MASRTPVELRAGLVDDIGAPAGNPGDPPMRFSDVFYAVAFVILLGWLVLGSVIDAEYSGGTFADDANTTSSPPADSASSSQPRPVATATVDERSFRIFVGGSPDVYSVAVSEDD